MAQSQQNDLGAGSNSLQPGAKLGSYEVDRPLTRSPMAESALAWQAGASGFRRQVMLKRILPHLASDPEFRKPLADEAAAAAALSHPNIVHIIEVLDEKPDEYVIAMEYVQGDSLRRILSESIATKTALPTGAAVRIMTSLCDALDYAFNDKGSGGSPRHVVHSDINPSNVLVSMTGQVKLVDFGLANALRSQAFTRTGHRLGKLPYMSPEHLEGKKVDQRSDLFSLGVLLYEATTGKSPFARDTEEASQKALTTEPIPKPSSVVSDYPAQLEKIVMRALQRDPAKRFQSAAELSKALSAAAKAAGWKTESQGLANLMHTLFPDSLVSTSARRSQYVAQVAKASGNANAEDDSVLGQTQVSSSTVFVVAALLGAVSVAVWIVLSML